MEPILDEMIAIQEGVMVTLADGNNVVYKAFVTKEFDTFFVGAFRASKNPLCSMGIGVLFKDHPDEPYWISNEEALKLLLTDGIKDLKYPGNEKE